MWFLSARELAGGSLGHLSIPSQQNNPLNHNNKNHQNQSSGAYVARSLSWNGAEFEMAKVRGLARSVYLRRCIPPLMSDPFHAIQ